MTSPKPKVLFLCTANSCRSQMAEGWARALLADVIEPHSAGIHAADVDPRAIAVMKEAGVDISAQRSKTVADLPHAAFDCAITLCDGARDACPVFPAASLTLHRPFDDPPRLAASARNEAEALAHYRRVRDEIRRFIEQLPALLQKAGLLPRRR